MQMGEFCQTIGATSDAVRHYMSLGLLSPDKNGSRYTFGEKDMSDFYAIKELQDLGLTLPEIRKIFILKEQHGCGAPELIETISQRLRALSDELVAKRQRLTQKIEAVESILAALDRRGGD
jgi:DNA-binding transcriptional MerR regulator